MPLKRRQSGQAMTEFLVVAAVLLPLFLLMPMVAKYQDIAHSAQMASRYVAFDATIRNDSASSWKSEAQLSAETQRRFFSNTDAPVRTHEAAQDVRAQQNGFWRTPQNAPLITSIRDDVVVTFGPQRGARHADAFTGASDGDPFGLQGALSLDARGIYGGNVSVRLANLSSGNRFLEPFDRIDLAVQRGTSILIDGWTGRDPKSVQGKLDSPTIFPGSMLRAISPVTDVVVSAFEIPLLTKEGPKLGELDFWADIVPADRLRDK